jgi:hypothetical protein
MGAKPELWKGSDAGLPSFCVRSFATMTGAGADLDRSGWWGRHRERLCRYQRSHSTATGCGRVPKKSGHLATPKKESVSARHYTPNTDPQSLLFNRIARHSWTLLITVRTTLQIDKASLVIRLRLSVPALSEDGFLRVMAIVTSRRVELTSTFQLALLKQGARMACL